MNAKYVAVTEVKLNKSTATIKVGSTQVLEATVKPNNATNKTVTWTSSDEAVATVSNGTVTAKAAGEAKITATADGKSAVCTVTVAENVIEVTDIEIDKTTLQLEEGDTALITATVKPENATDKFVSWKSSDEEIATVSEGTVTAKKAGTAEITATAGNKSVKCTVTVKVKYIAVTEVVLKSSTALKVGASEVLEATVKPENATNKTVTWTSSNEAVATVSNGTVTAKKAGTAIITATADGVSANCTVTVAENVVEVTGVTLSKTELELEVGQTEKLTATVAPSNATDQNVTWKSSNEAVATVVEGLITAKGVGTAKITASVGEKSAVCELAVIAKTDDGIGGNGGNSGNDDDDNKPPENSLITYAHAGEESAAFEWKDTNASNSKVQYKLSTASSYTSIDKQLIRQISSTNARADILGLKGGEKYDFKITSSDGKVATVNEVTIASIDRSGYAHTNMNGVGVGAYNNDGTLKSNATVIYVTEATKNNVVNSNGVAQGKSIAQYLIGAKNNSDPIVIRIIGTVGSATWNEIKYPKPAQGQKISESLIKGVNNKKLPTDSDSLTQAALISGGYNSLNYYPDAYNGKKCDEIKGLISKATYKSGEYDSCWNDCQVSYLKNVTVEGVGEDAEIFQWGLTFKNCNSIEVRNIRFFDYTEDACSFEASGTSDPVTPKELSSFTSKNFWVHHNVFDIGMNYWDVCAEQDKGDGDGATDFKRLAYVTVAYNRYNGTHKTGLVGSGDDVYQACFTFHHNYYNGCDQRMPLGRQANMHLYNNYYSGSGLYSVSLRGGAYAYIENCVFTSKSKDTKPIKLEKGSNGVPSAKVVDCEISGTISNEISGVNNLYQGTREKATDVVGDNIYGVNFEKNLPYSVTNKLATDEVKDTIPDIAGNMKLTRKNNIKIEGSSQEDDPPEVTPNPPVTDPDTKTNVSLSISAAVESGKLSIGEKQNINNVTLAEGIALNTTGEATKIDAKERTIGGKTFGHRVVIKSKGNYFAITTKDACTIKVYVINESTTDTAGRQIGLYKETSGTTLVDGTTTTNILGGVDNAKVVEYKITAAGTFYLESITNELSIYRIDIIYS